MKRKQAGDAQQGLFASLLQSVGTLGPESEETQQILSELYVLARKKQFADEMKKLDPQAFPLGRFLLSTRPKTRKNAARLIGILSLERETDGLIRLLETEETLYVIPSVLLALGNMKSESAVKALRSYTVPEPSCTEEVKHTDEIREALQKALGRTEEPELPILDKLIKPELFLVTAPEGFADTLYAEMLEKGFETLMTETGCRTQTDDLARLCTLRCAQEFLIPIGAAPLSAEDIAPHFSPYASHPYRIELRGYAGNRSPFISKLAKAVGGVNSPSGYAFEFRVVCSGEKADLYVKPCRIPDQRYAYRQGTVPASIHPATAACIVRSAKALFGQGKEDPVILDPCGGSGTLLFEREAYARCRNILGLDIQTDAVETSRKNAAAGGSAARFIQKDLIRFRMREQVDELYANLPFGNRVGSHERNRELYAVLVKRLPEWLSDDGFAVLYTMEHRMLQQLLKAEKSLVIADIRAAEAGGLYPKVYYVKKKTV